MSIEQMKDFIKARYSPEFGRKVDRMPDNQIIAIYNRLKEKESRR